jgi:hypothetical protein
MCILRRACIRLGNDCIFGGAREITVSRGTDIIASRPVRKGRPRLLRPGSGNRYGHSLFQDVGGLFAAVPSAAVAARASDFRAQRLCAGALSAPSSVSEASRLSVSPASVPDGAIVPARAEGRRIARRVAALHPAARDHRAAVGEPLCAPLRRAEDGGRVPPAQRVQDAHRPPLARRVGAITRASSGGRRITRTPVGHSTARRRGRTTASMGGISARPGSGRTSPGSTAPRSSGLGSRRQPQATCTMQSTTTEYASSRPTTGRTAPTSGPASTTTGHVSEME